MKKKAEQAKSSYTILLCGVINGETVDNFMESLIPADAQILPGGITVRITSVGGEAEAGFAICDAIRLARNKITTEVWGEAASMAVAVFEAGDKRLMSPSSRIMVHNMHLGFETTGGIRAFKSFLKNAEDLEKSYIELISSKSNVSSALVRYWIDKSETFSAEEAVAAGLADDIIKSSKGK